MLLPFEERFGPRDDYGAVMPEAEVQRIADGGGANAMDGRGELTLGPPAKPLGPFAATPKPGRPAATRTLSRTLSLSLSLSLTLTEAEAEAEP